MNKNSMITASFKAAFPKTIPIMAGFLFLGTTYGILMDSKGFGALFTIMISVTVFAGSMQFVAVNLLLGAFNPAQALLMTLMINARHIFYGISMLDKYKGLGRKKLYLIFGMCDESFSINCTTKIPENCDKGWYMFFVTLLNQLYWIAGTAIGAVCSSLIRFNIEGIDFSMTAMFTVILLEQLLNKDSRQSAIYGIGVSLFCLIVFGSDSFIIPSMLGIFTVLALAKNSFEKGGGLQ